MKWDDELSLENLWNNKESVYEMDEDGHPKKKGKSFISVHNEFIYGDGMNFDMIEIVYRPSDTEEIVVASNRGKNGRYRRNSFKEAYLQFVQRACEISNEIKELFLNYDENEKMQLYKVDEYNAFSNSKKSSLRGNTNKPIVIDGTMYVIGQNLKICEYLRVCCERIPTNQRAKWFIRITGAKKREFSRVIDSEEIANVDAIKDSFVISVTDELIRAENREGNKKVCNISFDRVNQIRKKIGDIGEQLVFEFEKNKLVLGGRSDLADNVTIVAKTVGDGLGYDVLSYDLLGRELHIEVKTTTAKMTDGFYISSNELEVSMKDPNYVIYRLYGLDVEKGVADMHIYEMPLEGEQYVFKPTGYRVFIK